MEQNREWHDPVVGIFSNVVSRRVRGLVEGYDLANRRWCRLEVEADIDDDQSLSFTIARHLMQYY